MFSEDEISEFINEKKDAVKELHRFALKHRRLIVDGDDITDDTREIMPHVLANCRKAPEHFVELVRDVIVERSIDGKTIFRPDDKDTDKMFDYQTMSYFVSYLTEGEHTLSRHSEHVEIGGKVRFVAMTEDDFFHWLMEKFINVSKPADADFPYRAFIRVFGDRVGRSGVLSNEARAVFVWNELILPSNGDDVVRAIVYGVTKRPLLIKSDTVMDQISAATPNAYHIERLLENHVIYCSNVFNRHKPIFLSIKKLLKRTTGNGGIVNRISKLSKKHHEPVRKGISEIMTIAREEPGRVRDVIERADLRHVLKLYSFIYNEKRRGAVRVFHIRNGKTHVTYSPNTDERLEMVGRVEKIVIKELRKRLSHLGGKAFRFPKHVDYGLPVSRKQCIGNLPFGTKIGVDDGKDLVVGIYWRSDYGVDDYDITAHDVKSGHRHGWGNPHVFQDEDVKFSGDVVHGGDGAFEFFRFGRNSDKRFAVSLSIFAFSQHKGEHVRVDVLVGSANQQAVKRGKAEEWIEDTTISHPIHLPSDCHRTMMLGYVVDNSLVLASGETGRTGISTFGGDNKETDEDRIPFRFYPCFSDLVRLVGGNIIRNENHSVEYDISDVEADVFELLEGSLYP